MNLVPTNRPRWLPCAVAGLSLCVCGVGWSAPVTCISGASAPVLDPLSVSAEVGDFTLACSGGVQGDPPLLVTLQSFLNAEILQATTPTLSNGVNNYAGVVTGANSILFSNVSLDPFSTFFTFSDIFVNPSLLPENSLVVEFVLFNGAAAAIDNPQQVVGSRGATPVQVPEPASAWLLAMGVGALLLGFINKRRPGETTRLRALG